MDTTPRCKLPYLMASQAQKEVTHNLALTRLDMLLHPVVLALNVTTPPTSPAEGDCYTIGTGATGAFAGHAQALACYLTGGWQFIDPFIWMDVVNADDNTRYLFNGTGWVPYGLLNRPDGASVRVEQLQQTVALSGSSVSTTIQIPDRATVLAVHSKVVQAVTGPSSFSVGVTGDTSRYGNGLGTSVGNANVGVSYSPVAYYAATPLRITPTTGSFTGGSIKVTIQFIICSVN